MATLGEVPVRFIAIAMCAGLLAGCAATSAQVLNRLGGNFIGQNVDAMVTEFGPPANTFKMNSGETSYVWQLTSQTNIDTYKGSGTAQTIFCKINVIASPAGIVSKISTEDASNLDGESLCARRLGMKRS
jgi:hypothetical protein